jgi:putative redox protein
MNLSAKIEWEQGLAFRAALDGHEFIIDGVTEAGGRDLGPRPKGLTLVSLAGCTGMDIISILGKMRVQVDRFRIETEAITAEEHPRKFLEIKVTYVFEGVGITPEPLRKAIALSEEKYCGVRATLMPTVQIRHEIVLNGENIPG